ncbi:MAG: TM2 domain-containing protein [Lactobacillaceae bacterium]|jgi:TM2 domain-containing membrane protein YozV|nr:TM2 domain-containing protein [Lactobacillaceae bacterium]
MRQDEKIAPTNPVSVDVEKSSDTSSHVVDKTTYAVAAIFLGSLGVHKFISGKPKTGIVYLAVTLGTVILTMSGWGTASIGTYLMVLLGVIEGVIGLLKPSDENDNISV